ncbi:MAG: efflux RND transporter periplasmic adaptor subunit, partial [Chloroflexota bacterium]
MIVVHDDGTTEVRDVELGVSDVFNIQILSGLQPGEKVLQTPTQAD